jgi:hypothetical protein
MGVAIESFKVRIFEERAACGRSLVVKIGNKVGTSASHCLPRARPAINGCARPDLSRRQLPAQEMAICIKCCKISFSISRTGSRMRSLRDGVSMSARLCGVFIFCGVVAAGAGLARAVLRPASVNRIDFKRVDLVISSAPTDDDKTDSPLFRQRVSFEPRQQGKLSRLLDPRGTIDVNGQVQPRLGLQVVARPQDSPAAACGRKPKTGSEIGD